MEINLLNNFSQGELKTIHNKLKNSFISQYSKNKLKEEVMNGKIDDFYTFTKKINEKEKKVLISYAESHGSSHSFINKLKDKIENDEIIDMDNLIKIINNKEKTLEELKSAKRREPAFPVRHTYYKDKTDDPKYLKELYG